RRTRATLFPYTTLFRSVRESNVFAQTGSQSFAAKAAKYDPRLECAESTAELHAIVHVIFCGFHGVAAQDVRWRERKDTAQALQRPEEHTPELQSLAYLV